MSHSNETTTLSWEENHAKHTHTSFLPFPCTDLGSAQSSLVVPFWLAHHLEIEAYKQKLLSETCALCDTMQYYRSTVLFSSSAVPPLLPPPLIPLSANPSKNKRRAGAADEEKEKNTSPLMPEGWSTYGSLPPPPPPPYLSPRCNDFPFLFNRENCNSISQTMSFRVAFLKYDSFEVFGRHL